MIRTLTIPRAPDFVIGDPAKPYLRRWWVIPRNRFFNIYLHNILADDDDRAEHDHPWWSLSIILRGGYMETINGICHMRHPGTIRWRRATEHHRLSLFSCRWRWKGWPWKRTLVFDRVVPCWTLFITGPKVREWGFWCPKGWMHWREFCGVPEGQEARGDERGKGCGE